MTSPQTRPEGLYVHIPFCVAFCSYCDFASEIYATAKVDAYLAALDKELALRVPALRPFAPRTIYVGGGTPTALSVPESERLFGILDRHVDRSAVREFTLEANPGTVDAQKLAFLRQLGVNRLSFGVQSFQPRLLKLLRRIHDADQAREAVLLARAAGFDNLSIDLLHGAPTQTVQDLESDIAEVLALQTEHVSAYGVLLEDGTPLKEAVQARKVMPLSPEEETAQYRMVIERLRAGGLQHYEISNYARPGREAQHNLIYWRNEAYLGVGVSAASFINWERTTNTCELGEYLRLLSEGSLPIANRETLEPAARAREALMLELRLRRGVDPAEFAQRWGDDLLSGNATVGKFIGEKLMERLENGRYRICDSALAVADTVLSELV